MPLRPFIILKLCSLLNHLLAVKIFHIEVLASNLCHSPLDEMYFDFTVDVAYSYIGYITLHPFRHLSD